MHSGNRFSCTIELSTLLVPTSQHRQASNHWGIDLRPAYLRKQDHYEFARIQQLFLLRVGHWHKEFSQMTVALAAWWLPTQVQLYRSFEKWPKQKRNSLGFSTSDTGLTFIEQICPICRSKREKLPQVSAGNSCLNHLGWNEVVLNLHH